jgi:hypothetical protein
MNKEEIVDRILDWCNLPDEEARNEWRASYLLRPIDQLKSVLDSLGNTGPIVH